MKRPAVIIGAAGRHESPDEKGTMLRFWQERPELGGPLILWPAALVVSQPPVAFRSFRTSESELVAQAYPACDQHLAFSAVLRHLAAERALHIG
jgi:hypothetical protein